MKAIKTRLTAYTSFGYAMCSQTFGSKKLAMEHGKWLVSNNYAYTFTTERAA